MDLKSVQRPFKDRYRSDPASSKITLRAEGSQAATPMACSVDLGRAVYAAEAHVGTGGPAVLFLERLGRTELQGGNGRALGKAIECSLQRR